MSLVENRLAKIGYELPQTPKAMAQYVTVKRTGNLLYISASGCFVDGKPAFVGRVGEDLTIEEGCKAAELTMLNLLSSVKGEIGTIDQIRQIVKIEGYVNSSIDFFEQPTIINAASKLLYDVLLEKGEHARSVFATGVLPGNTPVIIDMIVEI